jgi:hypothetical protein
MKELLTLVVVGMLGSCTPPAARLHPPEPKIRSEQNLAFNAKILELGRNGDWLVSRGYHMTDDLVVTVTNIPLSHAVVLDRDNEQVIEAEGRGVHATPLMKFINKSHRILLIRPIWSEGERGDKAVDIARRLIGKSSDFLGTVGINDTERFYCSELAFFVYRKYHKESDRIPAIIEPGQMYLWGSVLWDSRPRN